MALSVFSGEDTSFRNARPEGDNAPAVATAASAAVAPTSDTATVAAAAAGAAVPGGRPRWRFAARSSDSGGVSGCGCSSCCCRCCRRCCAGASSTTAARCSSSAPSGQSDPEHLPTSRRFLGGACACTRTASEGGGCCNCCCGRSSRACTATASDGGGCCSCFCGRSSSAPSVLGGRLQSLLLTASLRLRRVRGPLEERATSNKAFSSLAFSLAPRARNSACACRSVLWRSHLSLWIAERLL
mmetsp:Transcript_148239/g.474520  ORF Transcript_148239/g.474520 Transcript_148239/m.474520 type:complete len:242 (+) Transcript_148239:150-875(+)